MEDINSLLQDRSRPTHFVVITKDTTYFIFEDREEGRGQIGERERERQRQRQRERDRETA
jgi:hypothetical protein